MIVGDWLLSWYILMISKTTHQTGMEKGAEMRAANNKGKTPKVC